MHYPEFVSKTQLSSGSGPIRPISLHSLGEFVGDLSGELNLCPILSSQCSMEIVG